MTQYANTFEGGTNGTAISTANSGGASGDAFDAVNRGSGATVSFDNTHAAHGTLAAKIATGGTAAVANLIKNLPAVSGNMAGRFYLYLVTAPPTQVLFATPRSGATQRGQLRLLTDLSLGVYDVGGTQRLVTAPLPANQWVRVEFQFGLSTSAAVALQTYNTPDSATPTENLSTSGINMGGTADRLVVGAANSLANLPALWVDDFAVNDTGTPIGSSVAAASSEAWGAIPI